MKEKMKSDGFEKKSSSVKKAWESGFTLVELIITIAIMAILSTVVVVGFGTIGQANARKTAQKIDGKISTLQTSSMTKAGQPYLYIYKDSSGYKGLIYYGTKDDPSSKDGYSKLSDIPADVRSESFDIPGDSVKITDQGNTELSGGMIKLGFDKSIGRVKVADLTSSENDEAAGMSLTSIRLDGRSDYHIDIVTSTGKHTLSNGLGD